MKIPAVEKMLFRCRLEQIRLAGKFKIGHPDARGIELGISDLFRQELLLERKLKDLRGQCRNR